MKLYREPVILTASFVIAIATIIYASLTIPRQTHEKTVDGKTPIPVLIGRQTIESKKQELLDPDSGVDFAHSNKPEIKSSEIGKNLKHSKTNIQLPKGLGQINGQKATR